MHEIHDDAEEAHQDDAGVLHAAVGVRGELFGEGAAGFRVGEDGVAFGAQGESEVECACVISGFGLADLGEEKGRGEQTNVCGDTGEDDLTFAGVSDRFTEVSVVPGIDFAVAFDEGGVGR